METEQVRALLRARRLPAPIGDELAAAVEEAALFPGISALEVAVIRGKVKDEGERRKLYATMLAGVVAQTAPAPESSEAKVAMAPPEPRTPKRRGHRSSSANAKRMRHNEGQGSLLRPNFKNYVLVGDSNLRNFAESLGYIVTDADGGRAIGHCRGGVTIRECLAELHHVHEEKFIVMVGINDIARQNMIDTIIRDFRQLVDHLNTNSQHSIVISPPPMADALRQITNEVSNRMARIVATAQNVTFLDLRKSFIRRGERLDHLFDRVAIHLSPNGLQVMEEEVKKLVR